MPPTVDRFHLTHMPMLLITWATFFVAAIVSFYFQIWRTEGAFTFKSLINHAFPLESWKSKSARADVLVYAITQLTSKITLGYPPHLRLLFPRFF